MSEKKPFSYTYVSPERKTALPGDKHGGDKGRKLHGRPLLRAVLWGTGNCLLFGFGLTCVLEWSMFTAGILCGILGIAGMAVSPVLFRKWYRRSGGDAEKTAAHKEN